MKYLLFGLGLLGLLLGFSLWSGGLTGQRFANVIAPLEQACSVAEEAPVQARQLANKASDSWEQSYRCLAAFLDHNDIDDISLAFASLADAQDGDFLPACKSLLSMLRNLAAADLLTAHNLF